jgi:hypothetical protein
VRLIPNLVDEYFSALEGKPRSKLIIHTGKGIAPVEDIYGVLLHSIAFFMSKFSNKYQTQINNYPQYLWEFIKDNLSLKNQRDLYIKQLRSEFSEVLKLYARSIKLYPPTRNTFEQLKLTAVWLNKE